MALIIFVIVYFSCVGVYYFICYSYFKLEYRGEHFQWLWNSGLQESARIVNPGMASWIGF